MEDYLALSEDVYIGFNGCSLRTEENLAAAAACPLDRVLLETDAPWCDIRATHASAKFLKTKFKTCKDKKYDGSMVKGRNEPAAVQQVLEVVAGARGETEEDVKAQVWRNVHRCFFGAAIE